jgi:hypothetical protein
MMRRTTLPLPHVVLVMLFVLEAPLAAEPAPIDVGSRVEMFVDRHLIADVRGAELRLAEPVKREVVLELNKPWEGATSAYFSVFRDGETIRLYYRGTSDDAGRSGFTCYAESTDGIHFTRPSLGLVEFDGSSANNILYKGPHSASFAPFRDANPNAKADERYKALCYEVRNRQGTMTAMASADAIHWRRMQETSIVPPGEYDSLNCVTWDGEAKKYRVFDRYWTGGGFKGIRGIESRTSDDFLHWSEPTPNRYTTGEPREHLYTSAITRCPGAEHFWLAFPMRFVPERKKVPSHPEPGVSDAMFMSSRDGVTWTPFREAWVRPGLDEKNWTERSSMPAWGIIETPGDPTTFSMYISEHYRWPSNRLRRLTVRKHGFASIHAAAGEVATKPITFTGERLLINYSTGAAGSVQVELQDEDGKAIDGFKAGDCAPIFGDELEHEVKWAGGSLARFARRPVRLSFVVVDADVYAFRFAPQAD